MSVKKFKFVSPGVSVTEIDQSQVPQLPGAVGPVIIGTAERGPAMVPVTVDSFAEFKEVFGEPVIGTEGSDDVWRSSFQSTPSYGAYAAKAYLKSGSPITFVRLLGTEATGGWSAATQRGLFVSGSAGFQLAAVFYGDVSVSGSVEGASSTDAVSDNLITLDFAGKEVQVSLSEANPKYIRKVLNTDPASGAWLGESFANAAPSSFTKVVMEDINLGSRQAENKSPESGWVISQITDNRDYNTGSLANFDDLKLFKFHALHGSEWHHKNIKVSIEDIRVSNSATNPYGSFSVVVRRAADSDSSPQIIERFSNVNLNPNSSNYIAKAIGDTYMKWENNRFSARGEFANNSRHIRVEVANNASSNPSSLPYGFIGPKKMADTTIDSVTAYYPSLPLRSSNDDSSLSSADQAYFGVDVTKDGRIFNDDYVDYVGYTPGATQTSFVFTLDDLVDDNGTLKHTAGSHTAGTSINAVAGNSETILSKEFAGFTMPLVGGFDGVDVTVKNPFSNSVLATKPRLPAYKAVERAIASIQDPEVVEMNLAAIPGVWESSITRRLVDVCEQRADALAVIDIEKDYVPSWEDDGEAYPSVTEAVNKMRDRAVDSSYGAAFFPWIKGYDEAKDRTIPMPPSVAMLGVMASSEKQSEVWFAPAGFTRGGLSANGAAGFPVVGVTHQLTSKERDSLYEYGVNPIASFPSEGIVVFGQKTLQLEQSALDRINVRRLMIHIKREISSIASTTLFDQNVKATWARFLAKAEPFLNSVKSRFGLTDFELTLDETTTTADLIDRNIVYAKVKLKPARAIEHFAIDFFITSSGASFEDL